MKATPLRARLSPTLLLLSSLGMVAGGCGPGAAEPSTVVVGEARLQSADQGAFIVSFRRLLRLDRLASSGRSGRARLLRSLQAEAELSQARALALLRQHGLEPEAQLWVVNALVIRAPREVRAALQRLPEVESLRPDQELQRRRGEQPGSPRSHSLSSEAPVRRPRSSWNLALIGAPRLWAEGYRGKGLVVAGLDTGVDVRHLALAAGWRSQAGWFDPYGQLQSPADLDGHGTQTMGLLAGRQVGPGPATGVAPEARWIAARIFDSAGKASLASIHKVFQWVLDPDGDPDTDDAPDVVSGSWGFDNLTGQCFLEFEPDLAALRAARIAVVFSAGNSGPGPATSTSPANNPSALAVGSIEASLTLQGSSSRGPDACGEGPFPELVAPGADLWTTDRTLGGLLPRSRTLVSGTSFAAPQVAGAIALLLEAHPQASLEEIDESLAETAQDLGPAGPDGSFGYGLIDLPAAHARLRHELGEQRCQDQDGDGYASRPRCGTLVDCDDRDPSVHPGACDRLGDHLDQDCDGLDGRLGHACIP